MNKKIQDRSRRWCFTINNYTEDDISSLKSLDKINFLIIGKEVGEEKGTPHLQGYVEYINKKSINQVRKEIRGHISQAQGNKKQNIEYCTKTDKNPISIGNQSTDQGKRTDLKNIRESIKPQSIKELTDIGIINNLQQRKFAEILKADSIEQRTDYPEVIWLCGDSGVGKTLKVFQDNQDKTIHKQSQSNKWWNGYEGQDVVVLDDIRADFAKYHELLTLLDKYPHRVEIKGGYMNFNSPRIYITSPYEPAEMYKGKEDLTQLMRRIDTLIVYKGDREAEHRILHQHR
jgi:hypothetical protein